MLFKEYAEGKGATLRELQGGSFDQLVAQLHPGERLFGVAEGISEELPFELELMLALLGIMVAAQAVVAMPLDGERQYLHFQGLVKAKSPTRCLYYAVTNFKVEPPSFGHGPTSLV